MGSNHQTQTTVMSGRWVRDGAGATALLGVQFKVAQCIQELVALFFERFIGPIRAV